MKTEIPLVERAFQLARSGNFKSLTDLKTQLRRERYNPDLIAGQSLARQLRKIMAET